MRKRSPSHRSSPRPLSVSEQLQAQYRKSVLPNGLRIVTEYLPHVRSVAVGVWVEVGSRDESASSNGISHFLEHMVFKGTERRTVREIAQSIESVGGYLNAFTSKEHTCYYARVLDEHLPLAVDVLSDLILHPVFPERELEKERGVVIEELKNSEDDPDDIIHDYFEKALFHPNPLGFPVIGTERNLRAFRRSHLVEHHRMHYRSSRMVIAAAGNVNHDLLLELAGRYFISPASNGRAVKRLRAKPGHPRAERLEFEKPIQQAHVCRGTMTFGVRSSQRYPLLVLNTLLGDGMSSRLYQNIRERYGFAYSVYSYANLMSDSGSFAAYIGTDRRHIDASIELMEKEFEKLKVKPVGKAELRRTKEQLKGSVMLSLESMPNRMMRLGTSELYFGEQVSLDAMLQQIENVTSDDVQRLALELFRPEMYTTVIFKPNGQHSRSLDSVMSGAADRE